MQPFKPYISLSPTPAAMLGLEWYPFATVQRPETFCFLRSVRDVPVSLVDGLTGKVGNLPIYHCFHAFLADHYLNQIRASYSIIDHTERFVGPSSMAFSLDGTKYVRFTVKCPVSFSSLELTSAGKTILRIRIGHRMLRR